MWTRDLHSHVAPKSNKWFCTSPSLLCGRVQVKKVPSVSAQNHTSQFASRCFTICAAHDALRRMQASPNTSFCRGRCCSHLPPQEGDRVRVHRGLTCRSGYLSTTSWAQALTSSPLMKERSTPPTRFRPEKFGLLCQCSVSSSTTCCLSRACSLHVTGHEQGQTLKIPTGHFVFNSVFHNHEGFRDFLQLKNI